MIVGVVVGVVVGGSCGGGCGGGCVWGGCFYHDYVRCNESSSTRTMTYEL